MKEKNIIIHIGLPKALSTFLQSFIFPNISNTYYEGIHRDNGNIISKTIQNIISFKDPINHDISEIKSKIITFLNDLEYDNIIISEEALFGCYFNNYRDKKIIIDLLSEYFPSAHLLIILRRQDDLVDSLYKHMLKIGHSIRFKKYINYKKHSLGDYQYRRGLNIDVKELNYFNYVRYANSRFKQVTVLPYEEFLSDKKSFLNLIYEKCELPQYYPSKNKFANRSYSLITICMARLLNRFALNQHNSIGIIPDKPFYYYLNSRKSNKVIYHLSRISYRISIQYIFSLIDRLVYIKYSFIDEDIKKIIMDYHFSSNKELSDLIGTDLSTYGYH